MVRGGRSAAQECDLLPHLREMTETSLLGPRPGASGRRCPLPPLGSDLAPMRGITTQGVPWGSGFTVSGQISRSVRTAAGRCGALFLGVGRSARGSGVTRGEPQRRQGHGLARRAPVRRSRHPWGAAAPAEAVAGADVVVTRICGAGCRPWRLRRPSASPSAVSPPTPSASPPARFGCGRGRSGPRARAGTRRTGRRDPRAARAGPLYQGPAGSDSGPHRPRAEGIRTRLEPVLRAAAPRGRSTRGGHSGAPAWADPPVL
ncbi:hypothetical protein QFZ68_000434 [Streptomyces sp. V1I6]|nr:hypothetical protein [Streptomyces sp. V1I6]